MPKKILSCFRLPKEMECMLALVLGAPLPNTEEDFLWDSFFAFTEKNRLETLCADGARKLTHKPEQLNRLQMQSQWLTGKTFRQIQLLATLASMFRQAGIRFLSMKGPLLAAELYGDPSLRHSNDLDLLVHEEDYEAAKQQLLTLGFSEHRHSSLKAEKRQQVQAQLGEEMHEVFLKDDLCVELHWRISFRYPVSFEEIWDGREEKMLLGQSVPCLGQTQNIIYLICHGAGHGYSRLRWLIDIYKLFTRGDVNYAELYRAMAEKQSEIFLLETLLLLYRLPSFRMPGISNDYFSLRQQDEKVYFSYHPEIQTAALQACHLTDLLEPLLLKDNGPSGIQEQRYQRMLPVVGKRVTVFSSIYKLMQPTQADFERFHFPDSLYFLYYIVRPFYKLWRCTPFYKGPYKS